MKKSAFNLFVMAMFFAMLSFSPNVNAQGPGRGRGPGAGPGPERGERFDRIPGLTEEQRTSMEKMWTAHLRKAELIRAEIREKEARMNTLRLADQPDDKAIDRTIDEISKFRGDLMKEREAHRREVRALLNDEQKVFFDDKPGTGRNRGDGNRRNGRGNQWRNYDNCPYQK
ncbi:MAG: periplasmic heavy metal sensor [Bacteroidota bacterium]